MLALAIYASGVLSALPDPKKVIEDIAKALGPWTYALVGVAAFLETGAFVGLVAPGETIVIAGGVIAGQGEIDLFPLIGLVWACAVLGDTTSFFIGRRLGRRFLERHGPKVKITHERLEQVEGYFERHGGKTILIGRFIGLVRALAPFIAGSSGWRTGASSRTASSAAALWATAFCVLGYVFWRSFDKVEHLVGQALFGFAVTVGGDRRRWWSPTGAARRSATGSTSIAGTRWSGRCSSSARPLYRWLIRPVARFVAPYLRFIWHRLTPGELGLELTTLMAIAGVGCSCSSCTSPSSTQIPGRRRSTATCSTWRNGCGRTCSWTWRRSSRPSAPSRPWPASSLATTVLLHRAPPLRRGVRARAGLVLVYIAV